MSEHKKPARNHPWRAKVHPNKKELVVVRPLHYQLSDREMWEELLKSQDKSSATDKDRKRSKNSYTRSD